MIWPRLLCGIALLAADQVLANACKEMMQDGVMRLEINGDSGYVSTASVAYEPSVKDLSLLDSFMDAAELKSKSLLSGAIPPTLAVPSQSSLSGVVILTKCVQSGRAYAKVWVSERSLKAGKEQARIVSDSLSKNPTPKPKSNSPSPLDDEIDDLIVLPRADRLDSLGL